MLIWNGDNDTEVTRAGEAVIWIDIRRFGYSSKNTWWIQHPNHSWGKEHSPQVLSFPQVDENTWQNAWNIFMWNLRLLLFCWWLDMQMIGRLVMIWKVVLFGGMYEHINDLWFVSFVYGSRTSAIDNLFCKDSVEDILAALVCTLKFIYWYPHYYFLLHSGFRESPIFCGFLSFYLQCLRSLQSTKIQYMVA